MNKAILSIILAASLGLGLADGHSVEAKTRKHSSRLTQSSGRTKLFKGKVAYQVAKAENLWLQRKYTDAEQAFRKEMRKNPRNLDAASGLGLSLVMQFKLDGAEEQFDRVIAKQPDNALAHTGKALVAINRLQSSSKTVIDKRNELLSTAENEARTALQTDPGLPQAHYALATALKEQQKLPEAYEEYKAAVDSDPQYSDAYGQMAAIDLQQGRIAEATTNSKQAIELNTANSTAHWVLGEVYLQQNSIDAAIKELNTALYLYRNSAPVNLAMGKAYEAQGNYEAALKQYERSSLIKPEWQEPYSKMVNMHIALGKQFESQGNTVGALKEYQQAVLIDPRNPEPYMHMADLRDSRGDLELAVAELRSGAELNSNSAALYKRLGDTLLKLDKTDDAIKAFDAALRLQPGDASVVDGLSRAWYIKAQKESAGSFIASNEYETAKASLSKAISLNPNDLRLRLAMAKLKGISGEPVDLSSVGVPNNDAERVSYAEALLAQNKFADERDQISHVINNTNSPQQVAALGDLALMIRDLDSAEAAFKKASDLGQAERARRGLAQVSKVREEARRNLTLGNDLAKRRQLASAVDTFRLAMASNPRLAEARLALAQSEERFAPKSAPSLKDAAEQYRAYLALSPNLEPKEQTKISKRIQRIENKAAKIEKRNNNIAKS